MKFILLLLMATSCVVSPLSVTAETPVLLRTFNNPTPEAGDFFGGGMAALGNDRVLIGDPNYTGNPTPPTNAAAVYLFHTNGTLLTTFTNPQPSGEFGSAIATMGSDRVVIGSLYGTSVCLFTTNGALVTTITDPQSQSLGPAVVALGNDKLLIGAPYANEDPDTWVTYGAAYLYSANGALLTTFTNPSPETVSGLGFSVAAFGSDRVVIGAPGDDTTGQSSGSAYVFSLNGILLATINNPAPGVGDRFGLRRAAFGSEGLIISAPQDNGVGSVYLFSVPATAGAPSLTIQHMTPNTVAISWPSPSTGFVLQQNTNGLSSVNWSNVLTTPSDDGTTKSIIVTPPAGNRFYRLQK